ncbi:hypothetical protein [Ferrimicrobium acidiphilum]|uniref:hypothetical protein n=1 Tax=Ferrimicrobium acidiphilum TaxID=121039 RepID=UPI0023F49D72|nr:hypothetical protein [Ferrimicrobium acidiphilum]
MKIIWERLRAEDRILSATVVAVAVTLFLPWHSFAILSVAGTTDGFHSWGFLTVLGVLLLAFVLTSDESFFTRHTPKVSIGAWRVVGAGLMFAGAALYLTVGPGSYHSTEVAAAYGPSYGVYLTFLIALAALLLTFRQGRRSVQ